MRALRLKIKDAFDSEGIEIPFPQQTIWVRGEGAPSSPFQPDVPSEKR
jgi:small-conductance mechanosensitive channel